MNRVYLDNAATTRVDPRVREAMLPWLGDRFGNPSSVHGPGQEALCALDEARKSVASAVGHGPWRVVFTSGGTEADNLAVLGSAPRGRRKKVVLSAIEHPAVDAPCRELASRGVELRVVDAPRGVIDPEALAAEADETTALVALIHVQNEIGTIQPVAEAARLVKRQAPQAFIHIDAVQALGQLPDLDLPDEADLVAVSSHKVHGPKGVGALLYRPHIALRPMLFGGAQQDRVRPGTENVPGIVGFGKACELLQEERKSSSQRMAGLSRHLRERLLADIEGLVILGRSDGLAPGTFSIGVKGVKSEVLLRVLEKRGIVASAGAACHSAHAEPSVAVRQAGLPEGWGALRLSLSRFTTPEEIDKGAEAVVDSVRSIREGRVSS